ncbi:MAG: hypothetical protein D6770_04205 [Anaerolineae bacterium]|nr:MAG: hypothetical protein D6770_04205 [Anaerolineae bacterium]
MRMILAIMDDAQAEPVTQALTTTGFRVTRIASTGGFMRRGVVTLLIGVEDAEVEKALDVIRSVRTDDKDGQQITLFVVPVAKFVRL